MPTTTLTQLHQLARSFLMTLPESLCKKPLLALVQLWFSSQPVVLHPTLVLKEDMFRYRWERRWKPIKSLFQSNIQENSTSNTSWYQKNLGHASDWGTKYCVVKLSANFAVNYGHLTMKSYMTRMWYLWWVYLLKKLPSILKTAIIFKKIFIASFYEWGSTVSRLPAVLNPEPLDWESSFLTTSHCSMLIFSFSFFVWKVMRSQPKQYIREKVRSSFFPSTQYLILAPD